MCCQPRDLCTVERTYISLIIVVGRSLRSPFDSTYRAILPLVTRPALSTECVLRLEPTNRRPMLYTHVPTIG